MEKLLSSVYLDEDLCKGCINCIKRCPTQAIRVRNKKAVITKGFCVDCGECIRICPHHAKKATYDSDDLLENFEYRIALPAPALYGQFNNLDDVNIVLTALKHIGFDDVYEVSGAAELVSEMTRDYMEKNKDKYPIISTACPSIVRLIQIRFPNLIEKMLPVEPPMELAASLAKARAVQMTGLSKDRIGVFFISPCPAKVTSVKTPIGIPKSNVDAVFAIKEIYPKLVDAMKRVVNEDKVEDLAISGKIGVSWGGMGGEASGLFTDNYLAADGIENVIRVLDDLEDEKLDNLEFIELNACAAGCVGGVLTVENPYSAKVRLLRLRKYLPVARSHTNGAFPSEAYWSEKVEYEPVYKLGENVKDGIEKMKQVDDLCAKFPGLDCGSCGAPTCRALAEDVARGVGHERDCIHLLREYIHKLSDEISMLDGGTL